MFGDILWNEWSLEIALYISQVAKKKTSLLGAILRHVHVLNRGSYMSAHNLLNLSNQLGKSAIKCEASRAFNRFSQLV